MPICTIHLLSLTPTTSLPTFLQTLSSLALRPLTIARIIRWIILPTHLSTTSLLSQNIHWDILLILPSPHPSLPPSLQPLISHHFSLPAGIPSRLLHDFPAKNARLLHPAKNDIPPLTGSLSTPLLAPSSQGLELTDELLAWIAEFSKIEEGKGPVSMLNLLAFREGMKEAYLEYGREFAGGIGRRRGGVAKIVGSVVKGEKEGEGEGWDEMALAHYPSLWHFADMLASEDYQDVNKKYRVPSLRDTLILCTSELGLGVDEGGKAKL
ncbi:hypothetical protein EG329_002481 [Mollisiaceae sp. DMI_Dod_QoI]|nr:hypothetical protein EG329_002481 [Helotiales sp. DMI_Dod_QoI]